MTWVSRTACVTLATVLMVVALATPVAIAAPARDGSAVDLFDPTDLATPVAIAASARAYYVLSIGVGEYKHPKINRVPSADDATRVARLFAGRVGATTRTLTNRQATTAGIKTALAEIKDKARKSDFVVIFLAGHGTPVNKGKDWVFLPHDFDPKDASRTVVWDTTLLRAASDLADRGHDVLLAVESCHSGMLIPRARTEGLIDAPRAKRKGRGGLVVATSCKPSQVSFASRIGAKNSFSGWFSTALCDGLGGKADANRDGVVTLAELRGFLEARLYSIIHSEPRLPGLLRESQDSVCRGSPEAPEGFAIAPGDRKLGKTPRMVKSDNYLPAAPNMFAFAQKEPAPVGTWKLVKREQVRHTAKEIKYVALPVDGSYTITFRKDGSYVARYTPRKGNPEQAKGTYRYEIGGCFDLHFLGGRDQLQYFGRGARWMKVRLQCSDSLGGDETFLEFEKVGD